MSSYDICIQECIIVTTMVLHNFIRAHEDNDGFLGGTCQSNEGGYYNETARDLFFRWTWDESGLEQYHSIDMWDASILGLPLLLMF